MDRNFQKSYIISADVFDRMNSCRCKREFQNGKNEKDVNLKIPNVSYISSNNVSNNSSYSGATCSGVNRGCSECCKKDNGGDVDGGHDEPSEAPIELSKPFEVDKGSFSKDGDENDLRKEDVDMKSVNEESLNKDDSKVLIDKRYRSPIIIVKNAARKKKGYRKRGSTAEEDNEKDSNDMQVDEKKYKEEGKERKKEEDEGLITTRRGLKRKHSEYKYESDESDERDRDKIGNKAKYDLDYGDEKNVKKEKKKKKKKKIHWKRKYNKMQTQQALYNSIMNDRNSEMRNEKNGEDRDDNTVDMGDGVVEADDTRTGGGKWNKKRNWKYHHKKMQKALYSDIKDNRNYKEKDGKEGKIAVYLKNGQEKRSESEIDVVKNDVNKEVKVRRGIFKPSPLEIDEGDLYIPKKKNVKRKAKVALLSRPYIARKKYKYDQGYKRKRMEDHRLNKKQKKGSSDIKYNEKFETWRL